MEYYRKISVNNLKSIQQELYSYVKEIVESRSTNFTGKFVDPAELHIFPLLIEYLNSISKVPLHKIAPIKFFISGPKVSGSIHMDYDTTSRIALNIPVIGYSNTFLRYYETQNDNIILADNNPKISQGYSYVPKNRSLVKLVSELEFTDPHLVRTDCLHQSVNKGLEFRVIATIRWESNRHLTKFSDFVNI